MHESLFENSLFKYFGIAGLKVLSELVHKCFSILFRRMVSEFSNCVITRILFSYIWLKRTILNVIISHHYICSRLFCIFSFKWSFSDRGFFHLFIENIKVRFLIWNWVWISTGEEERLSDRFWSYKISIFVFLQIRENIKEVFLELMGIHLFVLHRTFLHSISL